MIPVPEAIRIIEQQTPRLPAERVALASARGRVLAEDVVADTDLPPFDRAIILRSLAFSLHPRSPD